MRKSLQITYLIKAIYEEYIINNNSTKVESTQMPIN